MTSLPIDRCDGAAHDALLRHPHAPSTVADVLRLMQVPVDGPLAAQLSLVTLRRLRPGDTLFREGAPVESLNVVRGGTFKLTCTGEDGYEQVLGFADSREVLGLDAWFASQHPTSALALEDASVFAIALRDLPELTHQLPVLHSVLHRAASLQLRRRTELVDVLAAVGAEVRLARFLVQWSRRMQAAGQSPTRFHLRMCRRDIASYLGVAHATVSRGFGALVDWGFVAVSNRDIEVLDLAGLTRFARSTRRPTDEGDTPPVHAQLLAGALPSRPPGLRMASAS
jgi:CRP/FNR family transcriptional regulator